MCSWRWTEWSSCQVLCDLNGQEPVGPRKSRTREKFFPDDPHNLCPGGQEVKECDQECQSKIRSSHKTQYLNLVINSSEPFSFGNWISTTFCNDTCGPYGKYLEWRSCTPASPNLPKGYSCNNLGWNATHRPGETACQDIEDCKEGK